MTVLCVPATDADEWPSLGEGVCDWIEGSLVHGPGDIRGAPAQLTDEWRWLTWRAYEVYPRQHRLAGRRRFKRVAISKRKGTAKTEWGSWITAAELDQEAPVRTMDFGVHGNPDQPVGGPVTDPYIPMVATSEEQSEDTMYGALRTILEMSNVAHHFDVGLERVMRAGGDGKAQALAAAPNARDGARTSFQPLEETHRWYSQRLKDAATTMRANLSKRYAADAWELSVTTAYQPGQGSVAEEMHEYAQAIAAGKVKDPRLLYFHRQASETHDVMTEEGARAIVVEASGPDITWSGDIESILADRADPSCDLDYWIRVWGNIPRQGSTQAFDIERWRSLAKPDVKLRPGAVITLGFDGSRYNDSTALVGEDVLTAHQQLLGVWEKDGEDWEVPAAEVDAAVKEAFGRWKVARMYCDPPLWESWIAKWAGEFGEKRVVSWPTNRLSPMAKATRAFATAIMAGEISHDGNEVMTRHLGNARRKDTHFLGDDGKPLWVIRKDRPDSPRKIDVAAASILAHEARTDAVASGAGNPEDLVRPWVVVG
jgi:phage terminase large subunit-like protein